LQLLSAVLHSEWPRQEFTPKHCTVLCAFFAEAGDAAPARTSATAAAASEPPETMVNFISISRVRAGPMEDRDKPGNGLLNSIRFAGDRRYAEAAIGGNFYRPSY
jgi:hypothetical protein